MNTCQPLTMCKQMSFNNTFKNKVNYTLFADKSYITGYGIK